MTGDPSLTDEEKEFYGQSLSRAVAGPESTGYGRPINQQVRFSAFIEHQPFKGDYSILDVGCGTGDLFAELNTVADMVPGTYMGYDRDPRMVKAARDRFGEYENHRTHTLEFRQGDADQAVMDLDRQFDVVACIATLALKPLEWSQADVLAYVKGQIVAMAELSQHLVYVTLFSSWKNHVLPIEMLVDPGMIFGWAMENWGRVEIDHSYAPHDFALLIHTDEGPWWSDYRNAHM